jgi:hypothetical protein
MARDILAEKMCCCIQSLIVPAPNKSNAAPTELHCLRIFLILPIYRHDVAATLNVNGILTIVRK